MRTLPAVALVLAACGSQADRAASTSRETPPVRAQSGPDQLALRIPITGGVARVFAYPAMDSAVWSSDAQVAGITRILALDPEAGALAFVDGRGLARLLDFHLGSVSRVIPRPLKTLTAANAWSIYGLEGEDSVVRITPGARWEADKPPAAWGLKLPAPPERLFPLADGSLVVLGGRSDTTLIWHLFPPAKTVGKEGALAGAGTIVLIPPGDRLALSMGSTLVSVQTTDLARAPDLSLPFAPRAMEPTPSGDRLFLLSPDRRSLAVYDRFLETVKATIPLPQVISILRMDPAGRYLLARGEGDSVWVVSVGTNTVIGAVRSTWRLDLPAVAPDGGIVVAAGKDVAFFEGADLRPRSVVSNGAKDFWYFFQWNGFRPRAAGLDQPVTFETGDTLDTLANLRPLDRPSPPDSGVRLALPPPPVVSPPRDTVRPPAVVEYKVQFNAFMDADRANAAAASIRVNGRAARVLKSPDGLYRVILGPFPTKEEAVRAGQASNRVFLIDTLP